MPTITLAGSINPVAATSSVDYVANLFDKALTAGRIHKITTMLACRPSRLLDLGGLRSQKKNGHCAGRQEVTLDNIQGTEGRQNDFDNRFNPLSERIRERWVSIARANDEGVNLPPIELIQVGKVFFVRDGHHRVSVARAFGQTTISANVTVW